MIGERSNPKIGGMTPVAGGREACRCVGGSSDSGRPEYQSSKGASARFRARARASSYVRHNASGDGGRGECVVGCNVQALPRGTTSGNRNPTTPAQAER